MSEEKEEFTVVPREKLTNEALLGLVDEYILREGTDYGHGDPSMQGKRERVFKQLDSKRIKIVFSHLTHDCTLVPADFDKGLDLD